MIRTDPPRPVRSPAWPWWRPLLPRRTGVLATLLLVPACAAEPSSITVPDEGQAFARTLESGGRTRSYQVFVPSSVGEQSNAPVMISFHTSPGQGSDMRGITGFDQIARLLETIMVYPDATSDWAEGCDCTQADQEGVDDVAFVSDLIDALAAEWSIDQSRVYVVGFGQGGLMAQRLACELSNRIQGVAVVAATMSGAVAASCQPTGPVPFLLIHGTQDPVFPATGGGPRELLTPDEAVDFWRGYNQCGGTPSEERTLDPVDDGTSVNVLFYHECENGAEVEFYEVENGGHTWPNPVLTFPSSFGLKTEDIDAAPTIGVFFLRHG